MSITELISRLAIAFFTLLVLTRIIGRKEISQMTFFNFISAISIGTLGATFAIDSSLSIRNGLIALVSWSLFTVILGFLNIKSKSFRYAVVGQPLILVNKGEIIQDSLQKARLDLDSLHVLLRKKDVFSISDVDYAFFETNGELSVLKKELKQPATRNDINPHLNMTYKYPISFPVISDGKYIKENLTKYNIDKSTLKQEMENYGVGAISDVFYAEMQKDGTIYVAKN